MKGSSYGSLHCPVSRVCVQSSFRPLVLHAGHVLCSIGTASLSRVPGMPPGSGLLNFDTLMGKAYLNHGFWQQMSWFVAILKTIHKLMRKWHATVFILFQNPYWSRPWSIDYLIWVWGARSTNGAFPFVPFSKTIRTDCFSLLLERTFINFHYFGQWSAIAVLPVYTKTVYIMLYYIILYHYVYIGNNTLFEIYVYI